MHPEPQFDATQQDPAPAATAAEQIDLCQKTYGEISNYDRHYSTVRSALTTLVVGAGLVAAADPFKNLQGILGKSCASCADLRCAIMSITSALTTFAVTWLLFALAALVSLYFQRFTFACRRLEEEIEQRIAAIAGLRSHSPDPVVGAPITGFLFRTDFQAVYAKSRFWYFDPMSTLMVAGIVTFIFIVVVYSFRQCAGLPTVPLPFHAKPIHAEILAYIVTMLLMLLLVRFVNSSRYAIYVLFGALALLYAGTVFY